MSSRARRSTGNKAVRSVLAVAVLASVSALAACGGNIEGSANAAEEAGAEEVTLSYSDLTSATSPAGVAVQEWIDAVAEESGGDVVVEPYWSSSLLTSADALSGTGAGIADITYTVATYQPRALPVSNWINEQGSSLSNSNPHGMLQSVGVTNEMFSTEDLEREFASQGVKHLASTSVAGKYDLLCNQELEDQTDLSGLRVRAPGPVWAAEAEALGMTVVTVDQAEAYEALQRGLIDCQIGAPFMYKDYGLNEVAKHYYPATFSANMALILIMNLERWESLSPETQDLLQESMNTYAVARTQADVLSQMEFFNTRDELGIITHDATKMNEALAKFQAEQREAWADRAPEGVTDPEATGALLESEIELWETTLTEDVAPAGPGEVATDSLDDFPAWQERLAETFASRTNG